MEKSYSKITVQEINIDAANVGRTTFMQFETATICSRP